jgi:hypothetical protein
VPTERVALRTLQVRFTRDDDYVSEDDEEELQRNGTKLTMNAGATGEALHESILENVDAAKRSHEKEVRARMRSSPTPSVAVPRGLLT